MGSIELYFNSADMTVQASDPRPPPGEPLPMGWEEAEDEEGHTYYIDGENMIATYDDPRVYDNPHESASNTKKMRDKAFKSRFNSSVNSERLRRGSVKRKGPKKLTVGVCDPTAYSKLDYMLTDLEEIPEACRNKKHNRYLDILPTPATRVEVPGVAGDPASTYYNANWIRGADGNPQRYIACMGPLPDTLANFWRMVYAVKPAAIVMITGLIEKGESKCERYWPGRADSKQMLTFGEAPNDVRVITTASSPQQGYVRSTLKAVAMDAEAGKRKSHTVDHFWYNTWPDHGVPKTDKDPLFVEDVLGMIADLRVHVKKTRGPVVVHCSAGIGRTGTFIAIDHAVHLLDTSSGADPLEIVATLRNDRPAMVQHKAQFRFVHRAAVRYAEISGCEFEVAGEDGGGGDGGESAPEARAALREAERARAAARKPGDDVGPSRQRSNGSGVTMGSIVHDGIAYAWCDFDNNGYITADEATAAGWPPALFGLIGPKKTRGQISSAEWARFQQRQARK